MSDTSEVGSEGAEGVRRDYPRWAPLAMVGGDFRVRRVPANRKLNETAYG